MHFSPENNKIPVLSNQEEATNAALHLIEAIITPYPTSPFASIGARKLQSIRYFSDVSKQTTYKSKYQFSFPRFGNDILEKNTVNPPQGDSTNYGGGQT